LNTYATHAANGAALRVAVQRTNDQKTPLAVSARPCFSWQLAGIGAAARQLGYHLVVSRVHGTVLWDTGARQGCGQDQRYDGPPLEGDSDYSWRLRVRDGAGNWSPWSDAARFGTGPVGPAWTASWISRTPGGRASVCIADGCLRIAAATLLRLPFAPAADFTLRATVRVAMGGFSLLLRGTDGARPGEPGGVALHLSNSLGCSWSAESTEPGEPVEPPLPEDRVFTGSDGSPAWHELLVQATGRTIRVSLDRQHASEFDTPATGPGFLAILQKEREQLEISSLSLETARGRQDLDCTAAELAGWDLSTPGRQPDEWTLARAGFPLKGAVARARLYAAGCHQYELYINGHTAGRGGSFSHSGEGRYQAFDVTELVRDSAEVTLAALLHWYGPGQGRAAGSPALLVQLGVTYDDGSRATFGTGPGWVVTEGPYEQWGYRNDEGDPVEHLHGGLWPGGSAAAWRQPGFDDTAWQPATVAEPEEAGHAAGALLPQETALSEEYLAARNILRARDGTIVADFGQVLPARPVVEFLDGCAGRTIPLRAGYTLDPDGRVARDKLQTQNTDMSFPYTQRAGAQQYRAFTHLGFRYLELPGVAAAELGAVGAVVVHGRHPAQGELESSDHSLNAVMKLLADSARYGIQEQFVDTPTREKGQFLGDAVNISYAAMSLFGDRSYTRTALRDFAASARRHWSGAGERGRYNAVYPNGDGKRDIPDFSLQMVEWALEYYRQSGDRELLAELYPHLTDTAGYVLRHLSQDGPTAGLITNLGGGSGPYLHGIVDWPAPGRFGYDMGTAARTTVNAQAFGVLDGVARIAALLGRPAAETALHAEAAAALAAAMNTRLRVGGRFIDGLHADGSPSLHASSHATSFPLSLGVTEPHHWTADADFLAARGLQQGPMTVHRLFRALLRAGRVQSVVDLMTDANGPGWMRILAAGGTFAWEAWELAEGTDYSQSHAWSAAVLREIVEHLLGVQPAEPGAARLRLAPPICSLAWFRGTVPTGRGPVSMAWERDGGSLRVTATVPAGTTATLAMPAGRYRISGGHTHSYASGPEILLVPGSWEVRPVQQPSAAG
jgi:alpha-L-rhamnosidase